MSAIMEDLLRVRPTYHLVESMQTTTDPLCGLADSSSDAPGVADQGRLGTRPSWRRCFSYWSFPRRPIVTLCAPNTPFAGCEYTLGFDILALPTRRPSAALRGLSAFVRKSVHNGTTNALHHSGDS